MWPRLRLDIGWPDLAAGMTGCIRKTTTRCEDFPSSLLPCFSVRSGFDLLLQTLGLPVGSEVLMSAITVPDMAHIVEHHRLVALPVDLHPEDYQVNVRSLEQAVSPRSKLLVVAHLFGRRRPMDAVMEVAREHGLLVVEDNAQAYRGPHLLTETTADVALFSFGPIKLSTALGSGMVHARDEDMLERMRARQSEYPVQSQWAYGRRLLQCCAFKAASQRHVFGACVQACQLCRMDYDRALHRWSRNFACHQGMSRFRQQPCAALLHLLKRRLQQFDERLAETQANVANQIARQLKLPKFDVGWLAPITVNDPARALLELRRLGIDAATPKRLAVVQPPAERASLAPTTARELLRRMVLLPVHAEMPAETVSAMCAAVAPLQSRIARHAEPSYEPSAM